MSDSLYRSIYQTMSKEQHNVMYDLYMKSLRFDSLSWNTYTDIEHAVAQILILERNKHEQA